MPSKPRTSNKKTVETKHESNANGLAITALAVGVFGFLFGWMPIFGLILGAIALIFGIVALVNHQHKGMAITGLVLGALAVLASIFFAAIGLVLITTSPYNVPFVDHGTRHFHYNAEDL